MAKTPLQSALEKLGSELFTNPERGALRALFSKIAQEDAAKLAAARPGTKTANAQEPEVAFLPAIFKEAWDKLSVDEIKAQMKKIASTMADGDPQPQGVLKMASEAAQSHIEKQAAEQELGDRLGVYMFGGFIKAANAHFVQQSEQQESDDLSDKAPALAAALAEV